MAPSALAVVRLTTRSNLVGCSTGKIGRLGAPQNLVDVVCGATEQIIRDVRAVVLGYPLRRILEKASPLASRALAAKMARPK